MDDKLTHIILTDHALRYGLDGKSAYEIAQKYGYEGTEQEYAEGPVIAKDKANKAADSADKAAERAKKISLKRRPAGCACEISGRPPSEDRGCRGAQILGFLGRCDQRLRNLGIPSRGRRYHACLLG